MKQIRNKLLCVLTSACMLFTMTGTGVFAAEGTGFEGADPQDQTVEQTEQAVDQISENTEPVIEEETEAVEPEEITEPEAEAVPQEEPAVEDSEDLELMETTEADVPEKELGKMKKVTALSGYNAVKLKWKKVKNADFYQVKVGSKTVEKKLKKTSYTYKKAKMYKTYKFKVRAGMKNSAGKTVYTEWKQVKKKSVSRMKVMVTMKVSKHRTKKGVTMHLKRGSRVAMEGFGGGEYKYLKDGVWFSISRISCRNPKCVYVKPHGDNNYTDEEAAFFINSYVKKKHIKTSKKYLIWVSEYNQHLYVFKKKDGKWAVHKSWECSTGKASSPSPTGNKRIHKHIRWRHGLNHWSCFSSLNALHGVKGNWGNYLGNTKSGGCIRNPKAKAKWIYNNCSIGTRVIVF